MMPLALGFAETKHTYRAELQDLGGPIPHPSATLPVILHGGEQTQVPIGNATAFRMNSGRLIADVTIDQEAYARCFHLALDGAAWFAGRYRVIGPAERLDLTTDHGRKESI